MPLPQERSRLLREWLNQPPFRDLALIIRSRALENKVKAGEHLMKHVASGEDGDKVEATAAADQARMAEEFLILLQEIASGKKRDTDEPFPLYEVVVKVPKTNTTQ